MSLAASDDSASLASTHRRRSWAIAAAASGCWRAASSDLARARCRRRTGTRPRRSRCRRGARCPPARPRARTSRPPAQQGDVERAAAEVVDEHRRVRARRRRDGGVVDRRSGRLGDQLGARRGRRRASALRSVPSWYSVQFAGCVITIRVGGAADLLGDGGGRPTSPSARSAGRRGTASPTASAAPGSPTRRLNSRARPCGCAAPRRSAAPPNSSSSPAAKITDGTAT